MRIFLLALALSGCCASNAVLDAEPAVCETDVMRLEVVPDDWPWLSSAVDAAIGFWSTKGVCFQKTRTAPEVQVVVVNELPIGLIGVYSYGVPPRVKLSRTVENRPEQSACLVAHELGHHIGLGHVDVPGSVMALGVGCGCVWSDADEANLRRIR